MTDLLLTGILAALVYLCGTSTLQYVWMWREQRSAFASRKRTSAVFDDLLEEKLIRLELEEAGRNRGKLVVTRGRAQDEKPSENDGRGPVQGSLDLAHDLILRLPSDDGVRA